MRCNNSQDWIFLLLSSTTVASQSTDYKPVCSFFSCFIMLSWRSLTLIHCILCVCVRGWTLLPVFSLSQSILDYKEFKRGGPFDPYINAKVCTHDLWPLTCTLYLSTSRLAVWFLCWGQRCFTLFSRLWIIQAHIRVWLHTKTCDTWGFGSW